MLRVTVRLDELSDKYAKVEGGRDQTAPVTLVPIQTKVFDISEGGSLTISEGDPADLTIRAADGDPLTDIKEGVHNNPNGIVSAEIAPKLPKAGGETVQVLEGGRIVERSPQDDAVARQGGGIDSKDGTTPGPKVGSGAPAASVGVDATAEDMGAARSESLGVEAPRKAPVETVKPHKK